MKTCETCLFCMEGDPEPHQPMFYICGNMANAAFEDDVLRAVETTLQDTCEHWQPSRGSSDDGDVLAPSSAPEDGALSSLA